MEEKKKTHTKTAPECAVKKHVGLQLHKQIDPIMWKNLWVCEFINDVTPLWAMWNALTTIGDAFCLDRGADWQGWEKRVSPLGSSAWLWLNKSWVNCLVFYCKGATGMIRLNAMNNEHAIGKTVHTDYFGENSLLQ
jgi:hypothetical protein